MKRTVEILPEAAYPQGSITTAPFEIAPTEKEMEIYSKSESNNFANPNDKMSLSTEWSGDGGTVWHPMMSIVFEGSSFISNPTANPRLVWWLNGSLPKLATHVRATFNFQVAIELGFIMVLGEAGDIG